MASPRIPESELPLALAWERMREGYWRQLGQTHRADECCAIAEKLERRLFEEG